MSSGAKGNPQSLIGTTVGGIYVLEKLLGQSSHGPLYEARHSRLGQRCAVRVVTSGSDAARSSLVSTLGQHAALAHPNLSPPLDLIQMDGGQIAVASTLLPGQDLNQRVAAHGKLTLAEGTLLIRQVAAGLHALHQRGLVHGNLTPKKVISA